MQTGVINKAKKNIVFGLVNQFIVMVCPFVERIVIRHVLSAEYLGLDSLFSSIITVLTLTELGFGTAVVYHMYKPAVEGNAEQINALLCYYRKAYRIIGIVIIAIGLCLIPFLPQLIEGTYPEDIQLTKLYLIYLSNAALSYFLFAYMESVIVIHQRDDIKSTINSIIRVSLTSAQIIILVTTRNYYLFSMLMPVFTLIKNAFIGWRVHRLYPQYKPAGTIGHDERANIRKLVAGSFIQRACGVTRNSLDSICISAFLGLTVTAIYGNYYVIFNSVTKFTGVFLTAFMGGIGRHVASKSVAENYEEMKKLDFVYLWLGSWCTICMLCLYQPFMKLWMGEDMLLPMSAVVLLCIYAYLVKLGDIRSQYTSATGLWWEQRYRAIGETLLNLVLNITLGRFFGVYGIIIATIISLLLCNYIWSVKIIFTHYFEPSKRKDYYLYQGRQTLLTIIAAVLTYLLCVAIPLESVLQQLIIRLAICIIVPNLLFIAAYRKTNTYQYAKQRILKRL